VRRGLGASRGMLHAQTHLMPPMTDHDLEDEDLGLDLDLDLEDLDNERGVNPESGKAGWALAWLLGIPLPLLLIVYLATRAC
jgi:hypothetical protein